MKSKTKRNSFPLTLRWLASNVQSSQVIPGHAKNIYRAARGPNARKYNSFGVRSYFMEANPVSIVGLGWFDCACVLCLNNGPFGCVWQCVRWW